MLLKPESIPRAALNSEEPCPFLYHPPSVQVFFAYDNPHFRPGSARASSPELPTAAELLKSRAIESH
jgi:hypothetical protein